MMPLILLAVVAGVPVLLGFLFRVSAIHMYVSVAAGQLFVSFVGDDAAVAVGGIVRSQYSQVFSSLFLLLLPLAVTMIFLRHVIPRSKTPFQLSALIGVGLLLYIFVVPILPGGVVGTVLNNPINKSINISQDLIVGAASLLVLSTMWTTQKHHTGHHGKHHK